VKMSAFVLTGILGLTTALCAQQVSIAPTVSLKPTTKVALPLSRSIQMIEGTKCDAVGNVYGRPLDMSNHSAADESRIPVREFTGEGKPGTTFNASGLGLSNALSKHVFVEPDGVVYQVVTLFPANVFVVEFGKDGSVESKTQLQTGTEVAPWHLAVFRSGRFLLSGEAGKQGRTPYTAVFEPDGRLVKKIYEPEDEDARGKAEIGDAQFADSSIGNSFVNHGDVTLGSDGNAYLMHGASPTVVYAISPSGDVVRKFRVASSEQGQEASSIKSYDGRLAFAFSASDHVEIQVTDLEGTSVAAYRVATNDVLDLACYDAGGFTLIAVDASTNLYLLRAKPQ
jgi:hypothetical protein